MIPGFVIASERFNRPRSLLCSEMSTFEMPGRPSNGLRLNTEEWTWPVINTTEPRMISPLARATSSTQESDQKVDDSAVSSPAESTTVISAPTQSRPSLSTVSPEVIDEIRKMIKDEVAGHLKGGDTITPREPVRTFEDSLTTSVFAGSSSYPSPPPSITCASTSSKPSSPQASSPVLTQATVATSSSTASPSLPVSLSPKEKPTVHFRSRGRPIIHSHRSEPPKLPSSAAEPSVVDRKWGELFDSDGYSTQRLGQVLRGIANYMITEYVPQNTLVVTPEKLLSFYTKFKLDSEKIPYEAIFRGRSRDSLERIEYLFEDLACEYHLVQGDVRSRPTIPALTPNGFVKWYRTNILAYPDQEAKRLGMIVSGLPITADGPLIDGKPERLPRQLSRHLLPATHDSKTRRLLDEAIEDCTEDLTAPLPEILPSRSRASYISDRKAPSSTSSTYGKRNEDSRRRSLPLPQRDTQTKSYTDRNGHRIEAHPTRLSRAQSDVSYTMQRGPLPPSPAGRHPSAVRTRSPHSRSRLSVSGPDVSQLHGYMLPSASSSYNSSSFPRGDSVGRDISRAHSPRQSRGSLDEGQQPSSPVAIPLSGDPNTNRRNLSVPDANGPTWEDYYRASPTNPRPHPLNDYGRTFSPRS